MNGVKSVSKKLGFGVAPMPIPDPRADEDVCPLCGEYGPINRSGYCGNRQCKDRARDILRHAKGEDGTVPGQYLTLKGKHGLIEIMSYHELEVRQAPEVKVKHPDMCTREGCEVWARPADRYCPEHRAEANRAKMRVSKPRKQKGRGGSFNTIRGLDKLRK